MENLTVFERPALRSPHFVFGLSGWPNAGEVATGAVTYLRDKLSAKRLAEISPEDFYDFTTQRPMTIIEEGLVQRLRPPANVFYYYQNERADHDLVLLRGSEPHLRWRSYVNSVLTLMRELGVCQVYALGGLYDRVPHRRDPVVSGLANRPELLDLLRAHGVSFSSYQGPSSLHTTFLALCGEEGIPGVSLWGHVPIYVQNIANPKVCCALLRRVTQMLQLDIDLTDIHTAGQYLDETLDQALAQNAELRGFVEQMEQEPAAGTGSGREPVSLDDADRIIREVEEFLSRNKDSDQGPSGR
ncbi:MAG: PAC2 family protein [Bacteroidetes bacterium]|nr:PAC2 family protein [Bacteroidota bacterium]MCL5026371.1 PAC2 family protein [Chloroflexota bacterium]